MFKHIKEMKELKKAKLIQEVLLLDKITKFVDFIENGFNGNVDASIILDLAEKMKDVLPEEYISEIVKNIKSTENKDKVQK
jgi:hypothetical protein